MSAIAIGVPVSERSAILPKAAVPLTPTSGHPATVRLVVDEMHHEELVVTSTIDRWDMSICAQRVCPFLRHAKGG